MIQRLLQLLTIFDWWLLPRAIFNNWHHVGNVAGIGAYIIIVPLEDEAQALGVLRAKRITFWNVTRFAGQAEVWVKTAQGTLAIMALTQAGITVL
jgi:hypothetical protein